MPLAWLPCLQNSCRAIRKVALPLARSLRLRHELNAFGVVSMPLVWFPYLWRGLYTLNGKLFDLFFDERDFFFREGSFSLAEVMELFLEPRKPVLVA